MEVLEDFRSTPKIKLEWEEFDSVISPILNNTEPLFSVLSDNSNQVNFYEAYIVMVLFCRHADYEIRLRLVFDSFDIDSGGNLDRRELSQFISAAVYGLCKSLGLPTPSKLAVSKFTADQFAQVDNDGSG